MKERTINIDMINNFKKYLIEDEKSSATIEKYVRDIGNFVSYLSNRPLDKQMVCKYKAYLEGEYAIRSANSMLAALNAFFRYLGWNDLCVKQFRLQREIFCSREKELTRADYIALINAAESQKNKRMSLIIQTICGTGIRVSELSGITVEAVKNGEANISCKGKKRKIFIVSALRNKLLNYAQKRGISTGTIFVTKTGKPIDRSNIWREMKLLCKMANVSSEKVFPHNLRHLFAKIYYNVEKDIAKLADVLGHSNINTTRIYIMTSGIEHRRKMEKMHLII